MKFRIFHRGPYDNIDKNNRETIIEADETVEAINILRKTRPNDSVHGANRITDNGKEIQISDIWKPDHIKTLREHGII